MEISAIMNIHELAVNRTVTQRSNVLAKKVDEVVYDNFPLPSQSEVKNKGLIGDITNPVPQHSTAKENGRLKTALNGNIINIHT